MTTDKQREAFEGYWPAIFAEKWPVEPKEFAYMVWQAALASQSARIEELETICAEAYQVVGHFSDMLPDAKLLDNLSQQKLAHTDVLPCTVTYTEMPVQSPEVQKLVEAGLAFQRGDRDIQRIMAEALQPFTQKKEG